MDKTKADQIVAEIKALFPHVETYIPSREGEHCAISVFQHGTSILDGMIVASEYDWKRIQQALSIFAPTIPHGFNFSTYEELQREHRCSCGAVGARFPEDESLPDDVAIFVCTNAHAYFVERKYIEGKVASKTDESSYRAFLDDVVDDPEYGAWVEHVHTPKAEEY